MKKNLTRFSRPYPIGLSCLYLVLLSITGCNEKKETGSTPENALSTFEIEPGFKIELLASEPLVGDPVDMEIDEYGRLYVVEMPGYPLDKSGSGKIKLLSDTNGDGRMDKSIVFAEGLVLPNSIMRWKKGVIVTDAPHVFYFEDTNNDGRADVSDTLLTGFALSNPQHNLNSPVLGIDNWIYLAHEGAVWTDHYKNEFGDLGREIYFPDQPASPRLAVNAGGRAVRFRPDQHKLEITSGYTQFGHTFDGWGHHFLVGNANHIFQEVVAQPYLGRNKNLVVSNAIQSISDHGEASEVFPITQNPQHQLLTDVGVITSACGLTAYLGGAFPPPFDKAATFVAEPVSNLIHVDQLKDDGASFVASRIRPHQEFLASTDFKFRPVNMYVGPDGALYVVDYYRQIIEHPEWMGEEVVKSGELYNDMDKGRIYRITPSNFKAADWTKGLAPDNDEKLVKKLADPNIWWRLNAQRLLVDHANEKVVKPLIDMTRSTSAMGRLHALWTLEGMGKLTPDLIAEALKDSVSGIRENAIKLAELHLADSPQLIDALFTLQNDVSTKVRFQLLCTLGFVNSTKAAEVRNKILFKDINDKWTQIAALSAASLQMESLLKVVLDNFKPAIPAYASMVERLATMIGSEGNPKSISNTIQKATTPVQQSEGDWQAPLLEGLAKGLQTKKFTESGFQKEENLLVKTFFENESTFIRKAALDVLKEIRLKNKNAIDRAAKIASDQSQLADKRAQAIDFIALSDPEAHSSLLLKLFVPEEALPIQLAALRTLSTIPDTTVSHYVLQHWSVLTPELRDAAIITFFKSKERLSMLLSSIESGKVDVASISWPKQVRLMNQSDEVLRNRARAIFTRNNEKEINKSYQQALELKGDPIKGKEVYQKNCSICHQIRGEMGVTLGPDLGTIHNWSREAIMANILAPSQSISSGYDLWMVELKNGESVQGIIAAETPGAITLRNTGSMERTISRQEIKSLKVLDMSVMPQGMETQINHQQMADLLAFLKQNK